jgi:transposase
VFSPFLFCADILQCNLVRTKNRLKRELKFQEITLPKKCNNSGWSRNFLAWIEEQAQRDEDLEDTLLLMIEQVKLLCTLLLKAERKPRELMRSSEYISKSRVLRSIHGVGPLTTMLYLPEVGHAV